MSTESLTVERIEARRLLWVGPLIVATAVLVNVLLRGIAVTVLQPSPGRSPLALGSVIFLTVVGVSGAVIVFAIAGRFARRPVRTFQMIALMALLASFVPDLALHFRSRPPHEGSVPGQFASPGRMPFQGVTLPVVLALMAMHVAAWAVSVILLPRLTPKKRPGQP